MQNNYRMIIYVSQLGLFIFYLPKIFVNIGAGKTKVIADRRWDVFETPSSYDCC